MAKISRGPKVLSTASWPVTAATSESLGPGGDGLGRAGQGGDFVAAGEQQSNGDAAGETCGANDQDFHFGSLLTR